MTEVDDIPPRFPVLPVIEYPADDTIELTPRQRRLKRTLAEAERRMDAAKTDAEFTAVRAWLIEQDLEPAFATEYVMVGQRSRRGQNLPY